MTHQLPAGWTEAREGGLACNPDPSLGGIIDSVIGSGEWFVIFNSDHIPAIENLPTREAAFAAHGAAIEATYILN